MSRAPQVIAHRAGNALEDIPAGVRHGDHVELDVHLFRGRLEVRHAKTIGPLDVLWERWHLVERTGPRLLLDHVLEAMAGLDAGLVVDMKGLDPRQPGAVLDALRRHGLPAGSDHPPVLACSRNWAAVAAIRSAEPRIATLQSVGNRWQLSRMLRRHPLRLPGGVSINRRLLDPAVVAALRARTERVWSWPVNDSATGAALAGWGVTGLISDAPEELTGLR